MYYFDFVDIKLSSTKLYPFAPSESEIDIEERLEEKTYDIICFNSSNIILKKMIKCVKEGNFKSTKKYNIQEVVPTILETVDIFLFIATTPISVKLNFKFDWTWINGTNNVNSSCLWTNTN